MSDNNGCWFTLYVCSGMMEKGELVEIMNHYAYKYNNKDFIANDPIYIPHQFSKKQDIEIAAFWTACIAWGNRKSIIQNAEKLMQLMDNSPHEFVLNHKEIDRSRFSTFVHRTFQFTDSIYFLEFFQDYYKKNESLENAFIPVVIEENKPFLESSLEAFYKFFFGLSTIPERTRKHVSRPSSGSRCKRLLMFLRWMVREDEKGVDFGLWKSINMTQLMIPLDVHVERSARKLGLLSRNSLDWKAVRELSENCSRLRPLDPAYYDFALFGMSLEKII